MPSTSSRPLMELLRNTPPPMIGMQDPMRSIPPPPLCPPPLTVLKMVPPPPLPSHFVRSCPPHMPQMSVSPVVANDGHSPMMQGTSRSVMEATYACLGRAIVKETTNKQVRQMTPNTSRPAGRAGGTASDGAAQMPSGEAPDKRSDRDGDASADSEAAELVVVLRNLVNLFTMTSQVKSVLAKVHTKNDDTGILHQVCRTRSLVETFREQLARRTVMLGRLIPPDTTGKPEIPGELKTKDPAGGDVSPQPDSAPSPSEGGTQAAMLSLQALVSADADQSTSRASRWGSRVKRRFLAASKPARRHSDKLKGPTTSGAWPAAGVVTATEPAAAAAAATAATKSDSSEEEEAQKGGYISPGCYVIDGAGLPRETAGHVTSEVEVTQPPGGAAVAMFGVPLSVMLSEASKKKRRPAEEGPVSGPCEQGRQDRSWRTACDLVPRLLQQAETASQALARSGGSRENDELRAAVAGLCRLEIGDASPAETVGRRASPVSPVGARDAPEPKPEPQPEPEPGPEPEQGSDGTGGWLSATFDEDWFLSTEREEQERERQRRLEEQER